MMKTGEYTNKINKIEFQRIRNHANFIASENYMPQEVLMALSSPIANKYAEGYPGARYYGGCAVADKIENDCIKLACEVFGSKYANVQPHSGSQANQAVYEALLKKGDVVLSLDLAHGGHLTHGAKVSSTGKHYKFKHYTLNDEELIDPEMIMELIRKHKPKLVVTGASAYSREIDFAVLGGVCKEAKVLHMVDMAHIAGIVATELHVNPVPHADVVTTTTHKTLRGPKGGMILTNDHSIAKKVDKAIFPGIQGGPQMNNILAKYEALNICKSAHFKRYIENVLKCAEAMSKTFIEEGFHVVSGGTDNHMFLLDVSEYMTGAEAEEALQKYQIIVNKNMIPGDKNKPTVTSGIRIGTPAMVTRGLTLENAIQYAKAISKIIKAGKDAKVDNVLLNNIITVNCLHNI